MERLVDLVYETVADPSLWPEVTRVLARQLGATAAWMGHLGRIEPIFFARDGLSEEIVEEYARHYAGLDLLVREWRRRANEMERRAIHLYEYVDERAWLSSEIYNEYCVRAGIGDVLTGSLSPGAKAHDARFITFFRPPGDAFGESAIETYDLLLPHLRRATRLREAVTSRLAPVPDWTATLMDQLPFGMFLLDKAGRLLHMNAAGEAIVAASDGLSLQAGRIVSTDHAVSRLLGQILNACLASPPIGAELVVPRAAGGFWLLSACPLSTAASEALGAAACRAWLCVSDPSGKQRTLARRLGALFNLTAAQQRVAVALLEGDSPAEIAALHSVSLPTVRSHVQAVFARVGVRRQAELVRVLAEVTGLPSAK